MQINLNLNNLNINHEVLSLISELDEFRGSWQAIGQLNPERLSSLRQVATIESVASSTRIEGSKLSDQEVRELLLGVQKQSFKSRDEQEVAGYAYAIEQIIGNWQEIDLSENFIKQLHSMTLKYSDKDDRHRGEYKKFPNNVAAFDTTGKQIGIIFETASAFETPMLMEDLINWTNKELEDKKYHPLIVIAVFVVSFLAIHPFQDSNGRLSRILTNLLLLKAGYAYVPYSSLENIIEANKKQYYLSLRTTQASLANESVEWSEWLLFFLNSLKRQKDRLKAKLEREEIISAAPKLSEQIIKLLTEHGKLSISELVKLTEANRNTIKKRLRELLKASQIVSHGRGRGTFYALV